MYSRAFERQATIMARSTKWSDIGHSNARKKAPLWHTAYEVIFMAVSHRGAISFGLVHIPVGLYTATQDNDIHFNQLCKDDHSRVRYKKVCASCGKEVKFQSTHPRGVRQQTQPIACLSLLLYYSIFYRILQASDTYKTRKRQKNLKIRCETPGNFMFAQGSHLF